MKIIKKRQLDFSDVLIKPRASSLKSRSDVRLTRKFTGRYQKKYSFNGIPVMMANMTSVTSFEAMNLMLKHKMFVAIDKHKRIDDVFSFVKNHYSNRHYLFYTTGLRDEDQAKLQVFLSQFPDWKNVILDAPNGYIDQFVDVLRDMRKCYPDLFLIAGNVVTEEQAEKLILNGADAVKVGIGSGAVCRTREVTGVGRPQLSTILTCAKVVHRLKGYLVADGGIQYIGDIAKALCAGADMVMLGSMLAGHEESPGEKIIEYEKTKYYEDEDLTQPIVKKHEYKIHYGMSSIHAQKLYYSDVASYRASEGRVVKIPCKGSLEQTLKDIKGGLRSTGTYINAKIIKEFPKKAVFYTVSKQWSNPYENIGY